MLKNIWHKIDNLTNKVEENSEKKYEKGQLKKGGFKRALLIIFKPYDLLFAKFVSFFFLAIVFAVAGIVSSYIFDFLAMLFNENIYAMSAVMFLFVMLVLAFTVLFMQKWYGVSFMNEKITAINFNRNIFKKVYGLTLIYISLLILPIISFVVLYNRTPNPNWIFELAVFTFYALLATIPFVAIRYLMCYAFLFRKEKLPAFGLIWEKTKENIRGTLLSFILILLFMMLFFAHSVELSGLYGTFWRYFALAMFAALITLSAEVQRVEFFADENEGK